jgi:hypothetical protein
MATGLQGDIEHATPRTRSGSVKSQNFCMGLSCLMMIGFAHDVPLTDDHRTNHGVGIRLPFSPSCQGKGAFHVDLIRRDGDHRLFEEVGNFLRGADFDVDFFFTALGFVSAFLAIVFFAMGFFTEDIFVTVFFLETFLFEFAIVIRFFSFAFLEER